ncbi:MAG TPA: MBL fold metallo-hydrolase [Chitinophagaceae bacterium]|nr:MBL fold metallo-hydrolase [Chitinophagaceae bacterium]
MAETSNSPIRGSGGMKIFPLSEGTFTIDKTKLFVPFDDDIHDLQQRPVGSLLVEIQPFIIITSRDILLLDTGLGFDKNGQLQIHKNLANAGISPSDITKVLLTHLHKDHAGGVSMGKSNEHLSFSNATFYLQEKELDFAFEKGFPSFITEELEVLKKSNQVVLLKDTEGIIDDYIHYKITGAHSPYHQVFWIKENDKTIFFGGDDAPQLQQMKHRFVAKYDHDGKKAMELRRSWWEQGKQEKWTFLFYHDVKNPVVEF